MIFSTQSTHKLLAGISQASQILVQESQSRKLNRSLFNEAYLMHTSTSPQYAIIASCDVAAAMMEPPGGTALVEESIKEALDFRRAMRKVDQEYGKDWWFKVWGPDKLVTEDIGKPSDWVLKASRLDINSETNMGQAEGASLRLKDIPILPIPSLSFPLSAERKSGRIKRGRYDSEGSQRSVFVGDHTRWRQHAAGAQCARIRSYLRRRAAQEPALLRAGHAARPCVVRLLKRSRL